MIVEYSLIFLFVIIIISIFYSFSSYFKFNIVNIFYSYISALLSILVLLVNTFYPNPIVYFLVISFFLWSNFFALIYFMDYLNIKYPPNIKYILFIYGCIDASISVFHPYVGMIFHKILLMSIYLFFGVKFLIKNKNKILGNYALGIVLIFFAICQYDFALIYFYDPDSLFIPDHIFYLLQSITLSILLLLSTLEENYNSKLKNSIQINKENIHNTNRDYFVNKICDALDSPLTNLLTLLNDFETTANSSSLLSIRKESNYLAKNINHLIELNKLQANMAVLYLSKENVVQVVEDICSLSVPYCKHKNLSFEFDTEFEEEYISLDLDKFQYIITNILSNAIKFATSNGFIAVNLSKDEKNIIICIENTGIIQNSEVLTILNNPLIASEKIASIADGTGLGLALTKNLILLHKGTFNIYCTNGKNTKVTVTLPLYIPINEDNKNSSLMNCIDESKVAIEFSDL